MDLPWAQPPRYDDKKPVDSTDASQPEASSSRVTDGSSSRGANTGRVGSIDYAIKHSASGSAILDLQLSPPDTVLSIPGAMVHMSATAQLAGNVPMSAQAGSASGANRASAYTGPGRVCLAPLLAGDILALPVRGPTDHWAVCRRAVLARTSGVVLAPVKNGFFKSLKGNTGLPVYTLSGEGMVWLQGRGAIDSIELRSGEQHVVENEHLVAWDCSGEPVKASRIWGGATKTGEGLVNVFEGRGTVYFQTRNIKDLEAFISKIAENS